MSAFQQAKAQCLKALNIIDKTQLTVFLQRDLPKRAVLMEKIDALEALPLSDAIDHMQRLLNEVLSVYNDPFANYIDPAQHKAYTQRRRGGILGVGIKYRARNNAYPRIIGALLGGPLEHDNIQPGDELIKAGDTDLNGATSKAIGRLLKGKPGTQVRLRLRRDAKTFDLHAQRIEVRLLYARADVLHGSMGYIRISRFGGKTHQHVKVLMERLLTQGVSAFVLDLRDNPGGSTRAARNIMSLFDPAPFVFCEQYKNGTVRRLPREGNTLSDLPLAVLVNEYTMSSAEILAGALQDYKRGTLVGAPTYGKGLIQRVFPLDEPLGGAVRTTIAMYGTPNHHLLHGRGLLPDIYVPTPPERLYRETGSINISDEARAFRRQLLIDDLRGKYDKNVLQAYARMPDAQLDVAIDLLKNRLGEK